MTHEITEIAFLSIDLDSIENVEDNPEAVTFDILLSRAPSADWLEEVRSSLPPHPLST